MQPETLDPQAVNLAKAIRQTESGGDFQAKGKSGEYGAYQFTEPTWQKLSSKYGINTPLQQATPEQQNEVAYRQVKEWKDAGYNPGQIASMWNAGEGEPDAYTGKFSNGQPSSGTNKFNVHFDVPAYAKSVATAYQTLKQGGEVQADPANPSSVANTTTTDAPLPAPSQQQSDIQPPQPQQSLGDKIMGGITDAATKATDFLGLKPAVDVTAQNIAGLGIAGNGLVQGVLQRSMKPLEEANNEIKQLGQPTLGQDIGAGLQTGATAATLAAAPETLGGAAATFGGLGAAQNAGASMANNESTQDTGKSALEGGLIGGTAGAAGNIVSKAMDWLPQRIARSFLPGTNKETAQYAVQKGLGTPSSMLKASDASLKDLGTKLDAALTKPSNSYVQPNGEELLNNVAQKLPDAQLSPDEIYQTLNKLVPLKRGLLTKLADNTISLKELHSLNSAIGKATFKTVFDDPAVKAGKQVASEFYHTTSDFLKQAAPDSAPLFDEFSKELRLNGALSKAVRSGEKTRMLTLRDLVAFGAMSGITGQPLAGIGGVLAEKALTNPSINLMSAGLLSKTTPGLGLAAKGLLPAAVNAGNH